MGVNKGWNRLPLPSFKGEELEAFTNRWNR